MTMRGRLLHAGWFGAPGTYAQNDEGGQGGGSADQGTGQGDNAGTGQGTGEQSEADRLKEEHRREADRLRNEAGQAAKKARELEARLKQLEDEKLSDTERLQKQAEQVPTLTQERDTWKTRAEAAEAEIAADVEARKKALPAEIALLMPEGTPSQQLAWVRQAEQSAAKLKPQGNGLPPAGGRNPGSGKDKTEPSPEQRQHAAQHYASRW